MTKLQKSYGTLSDAQIANFVSLGDDRAFDELVVRYLDTSSIRTSSTRVPAGYSRRMRSTISLLGNFMAHTPVLESG